MGPMGPFINLSYIVGLCDIIFPYLEMFFYFIILGINFFFIFFCSYLKKDKKIIQIKREYVSQLLNESDNGWKVIAVL